MTRESISNILFGYREKFLRAVDKGEVKIFQSIVYFGIICSGVYMVVMHSGPPPIERHVHHHDTWIILTVIGPLMVIVGDYLVRSGSKSVLTTCVQDDCPRFRDFKEVSGGRRIYLGWYFQAGGDIVVMMVFLTYAIAVFESSWFSRGIFSAFVFVAMSMCSIILVLRDVRAIIRIESM